MGSKRHLHRFQHPFDAYAFEALCCASWHAVELIRVRDGTMTLQFVDNQHFMEGSGPFPNIRIRSRQATLSDCTCFLRPGVDICVLSDSRHAESSDEENLEPVWIDAKINSIERKPHESRCMCQFYINFYVSQNCLGSEKGILSKETEVVGIDQISILQKLGRDPCVNEHYRWNTSQDCSSLPKSKLFLGKFSSDLSWLLVASVLKQSSFDVKSVKNKIVYQISGDDDDDSVSFKSDNNPSAVNFRVENGISVAIFVPFFTADTIEAGPSCATTKAGESPLSDLIDLRRSKRRYVQPERFLGGDGFPESDNALVRSGTYKTEKWIKEEDEMSVPLAYLFGVPASCSEEHNEIERKDHLDETNSRSNPLIYKKRTRSRELKPGVANGKKRQHELAIVPLHAESYPNIHEQYRPIGKSLENCSTEVDESSSKHYYRIGSACRTQGTNFSDMEDTEIGSKYAGKSSNKRVQKKRLHYMHSSINSRRVNHGDHVTSKKRTLSAGAYKELIDSYMKNVNIETNTEEPEPFVIHQWKDCQATNSLDQNDENDQSPVEDDGENSETEMLWREMELAIASTYLVEDSEGSNAENPAELMKKPKSCQHEFKLDEEVGVICRLCGFVYTEIKDVSAPFMQNTGWTTDNSKLSNEEDLEHKLDGEDGFDFCNNNNPEMPFSKENDSVWALIPELRRKLHFHQKKAFEFLWQNIAGSLVPALMEPSSENRGGCVVSHTPGAGKTFLIIAFLASYLKLIPGGRPLVLAPKTTLYTWYKEFIKWKIPIPVHLIHGRRTFRIFKKVQPFPGGPKPGNDVMHVLDCLEKMQKWHSQPSVLVMGYTSFLTLMREDSKFAHRRYMAKVLRESPGILILDEGHNPRSTKSRLRKVLMKVETDVRILLSGTLFQNNFCEYFNTLCLARPKFINEVLMELDPKFKKKKKGEEKARHLMESRARKFFIDNIARKIDSGVGEERMQGLNMLRNMTNGFIDAYEGGSSEHLPGLQIYTLLMNSTDIQQEILVKLRDIMAEYNGYPLELELLITLGSIHPWLIKTSNCVNKFFNKDELAQLDNYKFDCRKGSKVKFVLNIVYRVTKKEKVLIFCHNIAPINLFLELFENVFGWRKGKEVLVLTGDLELFERGRVMDKFEEAGGPSRILLASITACAEGISLTAASRVILLDSEWNPSKTKQAIARAFRPGQQKMVYVYQLLATGTLEEDKYRRTTWKEWVSNMIFSEAFVEDPSRWQAEKIEDDVLREIVEEDRSKSFHMIMKNEKASTS